MLLQQRHLIPTPYTTFINYKSQAAQYLPLKAFHLFNEDGKRLNIDALLKKKPQIWNPSLSNELGRLTQGIQNVKGNNAMFFIPHTKVPKNKKVAYANMVCDFRPDKIE